MATTGHRHYLLSQLFQLLSAVLLALIGGKSRSHESLPPKEMFEYMFD
jgi:hypothetical protein